MRYIEELTRLDGPKLHILELGPEVRAEFIRGLQLELPEETFKVLLPGEDLLSPAALFQIFQTAFRFPDYFGHNWDALDECLNDLEWLEAGGYLLGIDVAERIVLAGPDFGTFITILERTAREWGKGRSEGEFAASPKSFHVLFTVSPGAGNAFTTRLWAAGAREIEMLY
jgi:RNAse (barnase) inhibitor barstar